MASDVVLIRGAGGLLDDESEQEKICGAVGDLRSGWMREANVFEQCDHLLGAILGSRLESRLLRVVRQS